MHWVLIWKQQETNAVTEKAKQLFELTGWVIFVLSACFFLAATIKSGDQLSIAGSALFLIACIVFMVPLVRLRPTMCSNCVGRHKKQSDHRA